MRFIRSVRHHRLQSVLVLLTCLALLTAGCGSNSGTAPASGTGKAGSNPAEAAPEGGINSGGSAEAVSGNGGSNSAGSAETRSGKGGSNSDGSAETVSGNGNSSHTGKDSAGADTGSTGRVSEEKDGDSSASGLSSGSAAGSTADSAAVSTAVPAGADTAKEPRKLKYIDAWNEWHVMDVDPTVTENIYDPGKWTENDGLTTLEDDRYEVLQGVDVSEHQGFIDWNKVAEAGFRFAFIRVGYRGYGEAGNLYEDNTAVDNLRAAKAAGLQVGAYIFSQALNEEEAREEGALAVRVITNSGVKTDLPLMYDPELIKDDWGRANEITREQVSLNTAAFKDQVENTSDLKVDIYSNLPWEHNYFDAATMNQYQIWYADYEKLPQTPYHFVWWQYTNEGYVPGIEGRVDLNLWVREKKTEE